MSFQISALLNASVHPRLQWVEMASSLQVPSFHIVGLPSPEISEAKERVRSAIEASGLDFPRRRIVLNLSPASVRKQGTAIDLALALAILTEDSPDPATVEARLGLRAPARAPTRILASAELGLDGKLKPAGQVTRLLVAALEEGVEHVLVAREEREAALAALELIRKARPELFYTNQEEIPASRIKAPLQLHFPRSLLEAWNAVCGSPFGNSKPRDESGAHRQAHDPAPSDPSPAPAACGWSVQGKTPDGELPDGHLLPLAPALERAIAVAACGGHHLLLLGPRGTGKSHALEWLIALQPPLEHQTALENRLVSELAPPRGRLTENRGAGSGLSDERSRPVRRVGIQAKAPALIGSATARGILPGEFSRAHGGVLIADEFPEWARDAREALREPLERGRVTLTRVQGAEELPAGFVFAANGNLCPCGGWPRDSAPTAITQKDATLRPRVCRCSEPARQSYLERISGPILDRIDLVVRVNAELPMARSQKGKRAETKERPTVPEESALTELRDRVLQARERLLRTWGELPGRLNGSRAEELLERHPHWRPLLETPPLASLRSRHKRLRVALSLAAWDGKTLPEKAHFLEAALLRPESAGLGF